MKKFLVLFLLTLIPFLSFGQDNKKDFAKEIKKVFKYSTFYGAINGGNSISDVDVFSVTDGLETFTEKTPFDYSIALGVRKIARFGYENRANTFYNGTENTFSDAATIGKVSGFEFLFEIDYTRQQGSNFLNQQHFLRYVADKWIVKMEYLEDGFADIKYYEASQRYRHKFGRKFSINAGIMQRISEPYGYDPLESWLLSNGNLHYTHLAIQEGYTIEFDGMGGTTYFDPQGNVVAENTEVWEAVAIPAVLSDYVEKERNKLPAQWNHSLVLGFDYYHFTKDFWIHSWGNIMPYHLEIGNDYSYHNYESSKFRYLDGKQWLDYSGGLIFGWKFNKSLGIFLEGKYNKYWNRNWHDFSVGINYIIL